MALELTKELASGLSANYWRIRSIQLDYTSVAAYVDIELFKDAAARSAGKEPVLVMKYDFPTSEFTGWFDAATLDVVNQNPQERAYVKLKTLPEFSGAVDV